MANRQATGDVACQQKAMSALVEDASSVESVRQAHSSLEQFEASLYQVATLLHRLYYKSKAQHRSAKWFQSIGGMRKCFSRLLDMSNVVSNVHESLPDKGVNKKARMSKRLRHDERDIASIEAAKRAIAELWDSLRGLSSSAVDM